MAQSGHPALPVALVVNAIGTGTTPTAAHAVDIALLPLVNLSVDTSPPRLAKGNRPAVALQRWPRQLPVPFRTPALRAMMPH